MSFFGSNNGQHFTSPYSSNLTDYFTPNAADHGVMQQNLSQNQFFQSMSALAAAAAVGYGQQNSNYPLSGFNSQHAMSGVPQKYYEAWQQYYGSSGAANQPAPSKAEKPREKSISMSVNAHKKKLETDHSQKKKDFDQLVKARTDKLMTDGSSSLSPMHAQVESKPISTIQQPPPANPHIKLIQMVLDSKKQSLLKSLLVQAQLRKRQKTVENFKRRTELFSQTLASHGANSRR